jgi:pyruvate dehydrogenase E2 component (dihydrolipoamide acetyltransferase)
MTTAPPSPDRDAALDAAWQAHLRNEPPAHLDAAILAAAHRAVGSAPRAAAEATSPQRWWMPLAAAATIGAVALGILQLAPQESTAPVSDTAPASTAPRERPAAVERKDAAESAAAPPVAALAQSAVAPDAAPAMTAIPERATAADLPNARVARSSASQATRPATSPAAPAPARARDADNVATNRASAADAASVATPQAAQALQPFPAEDGRGKSTGGVAATDKPAPDAEPVRTAAVPAPPTATANARSDAGVAIGQLTRGTDAQGSAARAEASALSAFAAPAARAPVAPPAPATGTRRSPAPDAISDRAAPTDLAPASAAAPSPAPPRDAQPRKEVAGGGTVAGDAAPLAKSVVSVEAAPVARPEADAWIARIRKLHDDGRLSEAARELVAMRGAFPDADRRLPTSLREWAATVKP